MKTSILSLAITILVSGDVFAQEPLVTIRAGRLIDGTGRVLENARITLEGSRIARVDRLRGAVTYDLSDLTVMPGLIDTHVHLAAHFDACLLYTSPSPRD